MKRFFHLYEKVCAFDNLLRAFYKARKGKRDKSNVAQFEANLEWELLRMEEELRDGSYQPGPYRTFMIYDPKKRMISAAPFRDRVVHHALCNIIEPIFEKTFIFHTYANRRGKGTHAAIRHCQYLMRQYEYVLKADIRKYFPSIDHEILKRRITRKIGCRRTLDLIELIIDRSNPQEEIANYFPGDDLFTVAHRRKGLPMGNLTSQFFANIYLSGFDHFVKEELRVKGYIRYVDDVVLFGNDKAALHQIRQEMERYLAEMLRLRLHRNKTVVFPTRLGVNFLGQRIFRTHRRLKKENLIRFRRRMRKRLQLYRAGEISSEKMEQQLNAWRGHATQADTEKLLEKTFNWLVFKEGLNLARTETGSWLLLEQQRPPR